MGVVTIPGSVPLFSDNFGTDSVVSPATWSYVQFAQSSNPAYLGRTETSQSLPSIMGGAAHLTVDTYNGPSGAGTSFAGTAIYTNDAFQPGQTGIVFQVVAKLDQSTPGLVGGIFPYQLLDSTSTDHNEIDTELVSNDPANLSVNTYDNQPAGSGNPQTVSLPQGDSVTQFNTYQMVWMPNQILWYVDGTQVASTTSNVPTGSMPLYLNFWAPDNTWQYAYNAALQAVSTLGASTTYGFDVASVLVSQLPGVATVTGSGTVLPGIIAADTVLALSGNSTISTAPNGSLIFLGSGANSVASGGADTIVGATGSATVSAGTSNDLLFSLGGQAQFIGGSGADTVVGGSGAFSLFGGSSGGTLMFGNGPTRYVGGGASDTIAGLASSMTVQAGAGGGQFFGGAGGGNIITAGAGNVTALGGGQGDVLTATGSANDLFGGGVGAETLTGAGSNGSNNFFAGSGPQTLVGGGGHTALVAGAGADVLTGGSGLTLFAFLSGRTSGAADTVTGWDPTHDFVKLAGYGGSEANTVANATITNGSATIALSDGTQVTFAGVTQLNIASFN